MPSIFALPSQTTLNDADTLVYGKDPSGSPAASEVSALNARKYFTGQLVLNVADYAVIGSATSGQRTANTTGVTAALTALAASTAPATLFFPGIVEIDGRIDMPFMTGKRISGAGNLAGAAGLKQFTANIPIVRFANDLTHSIHVDHLRFEYNTQQGANASAMAWQFFGGGGQANFFHWTVDHCAFVNAYDGIGYGGTGSPSWWNVDLNDCFFSGITHSCLNLVSPGGVGVPRFHITRLACFNTGTAVQYAATGPCINASAHALRIDGWDCEGWRNTILFSGGSLQGIEVNDVSVENHTWDTTGGAVDLVYLGQNGLLYANNWGIGTNLGSFSGANRVNLFHAGTNAKIVVDGLTANMTPASGTAVTNPVALFQSPSTDSPCSARAVTDGWGITQIPTLPTDTATLANCGEVVQFPLGDRAGNITAETAGTTKTKRWYNRTGRVVTFTGFHAALDTAPTGSTATVVVRKNGSATGAVTVPIIAGANTGTAIGQSVTVLPNEYLQVWPTAIGATVAGSDLAVTGVGRLLWGMDPWTPSALSPTVWYDAALSAPSSTTLPDQRGGTAATLSNTTWANGYIAFNGTTSIMTFPASAIPPMDAASTFTVVMVAKRKTASADFGFWWHISDGTNGPKLYEHPVGTVFLEFNTATPNLAITADVRSVVTVKGDLSNNASLQIDNGSPFAISIGAGGRPVNPTGFVGMSNVSTHPQVLDFYALLTFPRNLTGSEIAQLVAYYNAGTI